MAAVSWFCVRRTKKFCRAILFRHEQPSLSDRHCGFVGEMVVLCRRKKGATFLPTPFASRTHGAG